MYTEEKAYDWTSEIARSNETLLHFWRLDKDPLVHTDKITRFYPWSKTMCDFGCGTGELLFQYKQLHPEVTCYGINKFAQQLKQEFRVHPELAEIACEDLTSMSTPAHWPKMDTITCNYVLGHMDSEGRVATFARAHEMLNERGVLSVWDITPRSANSPATLAEYEVLPTSTLVAEAAKAGLKLVEVYLPPLDQTFLSDNFLAVVSPNQLIEVSRTRAVLYTFVKA